LAQRIQEEQKFEPLKQLKDTRKKGQKNTRQEKSSMRQKIEQKSNMSKN
jgi:hypothetical protein